MLHNGVTLIRSGAVWRGGLKYDGEGKTTGLVVVGKDWEGREVKWWRVNEKRNGERERGVVVKGRLLGEKGWWREDKRERRGVGCWGREKVTRLFRILRLLPSIPASYTTYIDIVVYFMHTDKRPTIHCIIHLSLVCIYCLCVYIWKPGIFAYNTHHNHQVKRQQ